MGLTITRGLLGVLLTLSLSVKAQFNYPAEGVVVGKRYRVQSAVGSSSSYDRSGVFIRAAGVVMRDRIYRMSSTIYSSGEAPAGFGSVAVAPGRVFELSGTISSEIEPDWRSSDKTTVSRKDQPVRDEQPIIAHRGLFLLNIFSRSVDFFTRIQPGVAISLRSWSLENGSSDAEDFRYTIDQYVRLFKESERWSWDSFYRMKAGVRDGEVSNNVGQHLLDSGYVHKVRSRSEFSLSGRFEYTDGLSEEILAGDISYVDHRLFELVAEFKRGKGRDRVRFDGKIYAGVLDYDTPDEVTVDFEQFSHDRIGIAGNIYYQFRPRISYWIGMDVSEYSYPESDLGNRDYTTVLGGEFLFSSRLKASVERGIQHKQFDDAGFSRAMWNLQVNWRPRVNSSLVFSSSQRLAESQRDGASQANALTVERRNELGWKQNWSKRLSTGVGWISGTKFFKGYEIDRRDLFVNLEYTPIKNLAFNLHASRYGRELDQQEARDAFLVELTADYKF